MKKKRAHGEDIPRTIATAEGLEKEALAPKAREIDRILQAIPDLYFRMDKNCVIIDYRASDESRLLRSPGEFLGKSVSEILPPEASDAIRNGAPVCARNMRSPSAIFSTTWDRHGSKRYFPPKRGRRLVIVRDITETHQAEESTVERGSFSCDRAAIQSACRGRHLA